MKKINYFRKFFAGFLLVLVLSLASIAFLSNSTVFPESFVMVFTGFYDQQQSFVQTTFPVKNQVLFLPNSIDLTDFIVHEQVTNFQLVGKTDFNHLLENSIGKNVIVKTQKDSIEGTLVSANPLILKTNAGLTNIYSYESISLGGSQDYISTPSIYFTDEFKKDSAKVSFFSKALTFNNKYVGTLNSNILSFSSQSSLQNNLGFDLKNSRLAIAVGTLDKNQNYPYPLREAYGVTASAKNDVMIPSPATSERIQDFKQIVLKELVNLQDGKTLFFSIIQPQKIQIEKESRLESTGNPTSVIKFNNSLGDLPQGVLDLYSKNEEGFLSFSSETTLKDFLNGSEIKINAGRNYFITGTKVQSNYNKISNCIFESTQTWTIQNTAENNENVILVEKTYGSTQIVKEDALHENEDTNTFTWKLSVPKGKTIFSYTTRTNNC